MNFPIEICDKIKAFIPRDNQMRSPTADCIKHFVIYEIPSSHFQLFPGMTFAQHAFFALWVIKTTRAERLRAEHSEHDTESYVTDDSDDYE